MSEDLRVQAIENPEPSVIAYYSATKDCWVQLTQETYDRQIAHYLNLNDFKDAVSSAFESYMTRKAATNANYGESK